MLHNMRPLKNGTFRENINISYNYGQIIKMEMKILNFLPEED